MPHTHPKKNTLPDECGICHTNGRPIAMSRPPPGRWCGMWVFVCGICQVWHLTCHTSSKSGICHICRRGGGAFPAICVAYATLLLVDNWQCLKHSRTKRASPFVSTLTKRARPPSPPTQCTLGQGQQCSRAQWWLPQLARGVGGYVQLLQPPLCKGGGDKMRGGGPRVVIFTAAAAQQRQFSSSGGVGWTHAGGPHPTGWTGPARRAGSAGYSHPTRGAQPTFTLGLGNLGVGVEVCVRIDVGYYGRRYGCPG